MDNNKLEFDIQSMSEFEYKLREIASLTPDELDRLEKERQVAFVTVKELNESFVQMMVMAPEAWFNSKEDFKHRLCTDLFGYVTEAIEDVTRDAVLNIGNILDYMGAGSFTHYIPFELIASIGKNDKDDELDYIQSELSKKINTAAMGIDFMASKENLEEVIKNSEILDGAMFISQRVENNTQDSIAVENRNIKHAYVLNLEFNRNYADKDILEYIEDIDNIQIYWLQDRKEDE